LDSRGVFESGMARHLPMQLASFFLVAACDAPNQRLDGA